MSAGAGDHVADGRSLFRDIYRRGLMANAVGATLAYVYLSFINSPQPPPGDERILYMGIAPAYVLLAAVVGYQVGRRAFQPIERWLAASRAPTVEERTLLLDLPWGAAGRVGAGWLGAAVLFGVVTATHHPALFVAGLVIAILLAGLTTAAVSFLLIERTLRPVFALALAGESPSGAKAPVGRRALGTGSRLLVSWALGSGVALLAIALAFLGRGDSRGDELIGPVLFLVVAGLVVGGVLVAAAARSISEPVERVTRAVGRVGMGSLDEEVLVDDGGEIGFLEAGFNRMVAGLRDRERIRETFGTYVDREVAEHILSEGTSLAGEQVEVTIIFIDIRDFTGFAERATAPEVVATVNRLFERAVPVVHAHGGHVDKFVGDGLLAVFGAPRPQDDHADQALAAALAIEHAVEEEFGGELKIGIGLNSGTVVAGNVGGGGRLEFSVIGDAVNVAARVEAATRKTGDVILLAENVKRLLAPNGVPLEERQGVPLKGKSGSIMLYAPGAPSRAGRRETPAAGG